MKDTTGEYVIQRQISRNYPIQTTKIKNIKENKQRLRDL